MYAGIIGHLDRRRHLDLAIAGGALIAAVCVCLAIDRIVTPDPGPEPPAVVVTFVLTFLAAVGISSYGSVRAAAATAALGWVSFRFGFLLPPGAPYIPDLFSQLAFGAYSVCALSSLWLIAEIQTRRARRALPSAVVATLRPCGTVLVCDVARQRFMEIRDI
jgi:hypothetical protein